MTVDEALENLQRLQHAGHGELELIACDGASGVSYSVSVHAGEPATVSDREEGGELCEWEEGRQYIGVWLG